MESECDVQHFQFKQLSKIKFKEKHSQQRCQLISCTKYGQVIIARGKELKVGDGNALHQTFKDEKPSSINNDGMKLLSSFIFSSEISFIGVSCDHNVLSVVTIDNKISLMDTRTLSSSPAVFSQATMNGRCIAHMWNPGSPTVLATSTSSGEVSIWELRGDTLLLNKSKPTFGGSCLCWSSKGKQLAVGTRDGKIINLKPTLDEARCTQSPPELKATRVRDIFWISTFEYIAVYDKEDGICVIHVKNEKDKTIPTKFTNFDDVFFCDSERDLSVLFCQVLPWSTTVLGCSRGVELVAVGEVPGQRGQFLFGLDESSRAEVPYNEGEPSYPVGMTIDYTFTEPYVISPEKSLPPSPTLLVLTSENILCPFRLINTHVTTNLVSEIQPLPPVPPTRVKSVVPSARIEEEATSLTPNLFNSTATKTDTPLFGNNLNISGLLGSSAATNASKQSLFTSLPSISGGNPPNTNNLFKTPSITPSSTPSVIVPASQSVPSAVKAVLSPSKPPVGGTPSQGVAVTPTKPNLATPGVAPKGMPGGQVKPNLQSGSVDKPSLSSSSQTPTSTSNQSPRKNNEVDEAKLNTVYAKTISEEIAAFERQMSQHKQSSECLNDLKDLFNQDNLRKIGSEVKELETIVKGINESLGQVSNDIEIEKDTLLVALASLEEAKGSFACYNDPAYIALLKSKPLDKMTRKLRNDLLAQFARMQNLVDELNSQLDNEWENMHSVKKTTANSRTIYKTLVQHRTISSEQEKNIQTILKQISNLRLDTSTAVVGNFVKGSKPISPIKSKQLKGFFESYKPKTRTVTSPAKLNISQLNKTYTGKKGTTANGSHEVESVNSKPVLSNLDSSFSKYDDSVKFAVPNLKYSDKPKFDLSDPTKLLDDDEKEPTIVLKYMPSNPPPAKDEESAVRGAQEVVSKLMDFAHKEKIDSPTTEKSFAQQFIPVMRTQGPVAPGQAPNAVIQPIVSTSKPSPFPGNTGTFGDQRAFGSPPTQPASGFSSQSSSLFGGKQSGLFASESKSSGLFASEPKSTGIFTSESKSPGLFAANSKSSGLFTTEKKSPGLFGTETNSSGLFSTDSKASGLFASESKPSGLFGKESASSGLFDLNSSKTSPQQKSSSNLFSAILTPKISQPSTPTKQVPKSPDHAFPVVGEAVKDFDRVTTSTISSTSSSLSTQPDTLGQVGSTKTKTIELEKKEEAEFIKNDSQSTGFASSYTTASTNIFNTPSGNIFGETNIFASPKTSGESLFGTSSSATTENPFVVSSNNEKSPNSLFGSQEKPTETPPNAPSTTSKSSEKGLLSSKSLFSPETKEKKTTETASPLRLGIEAISPKSDTDKKDINSATTGSTGLLGDPKANLFGSTAISSDGVKSSETPLEGGTTTGKSEGGLFGGLSISANTPVSSTSNVLGGGTPTTVATTSATSGGIFGASSVTTSNVFGSSGSGGLFGNSASTATTTASSSLFGSSTGTTTASGSLFGSSTTTTAPGSLFGNSTTTTASGSLFGSSTTTTASGSLFGSSGPGTNSFSNNTAAPASNNIFGGSSQPTANIFGGSSNANAFGPSNNNNTSSSNNIFGGNNSSNTSNIFGGATTPANTGSIFDTSNKNNTTTTGFGSAPAFGSSAPAFGSGAPGSADSGGFGGAPSFGGGSVFGSTPSFGSSAVFGSNNSFGSNSNANSVFGSGASFGNGGGGGFGAVASGGGSSFGAVASGGANVFGGGSASTFGGFSANNAAPSAFGDLSNQNAGGFLTGGSNPSFSTNSSSFSSWR